MKVQRNNIYLLINFMAKLYIQHQGGNYVYQIDFGLMPREVEDSTIAKNK